MDGVKGISKCYGFVNSFCLTNNKRSSIIKLQFNRYMKIAEDERKRSTEGVKLSGDLRVGNCNWIALRSTPLRADAEGAKRVA